MTRRTKFAIVLFFFITAFIHASIWAAITPLWQIPDEAAHYEYLRILVKLGRMPTKGDEDPAIQADILRSMWENHYWEYLGYKRPDHPPTSFLAGGWTSGGDIPETGVVGDSYVGAFSNLNNTQPLYYLALAPVQKATLDLPVDEQLRALRIASRFIFALAVAFIVLTAISLFDDSPAIIIGVGIITSLQPMFAYIGSGLNNDVGVTCIGALLTWQVAAAWRRGWPWPRLVGVIIITLAAIFTKRTAIFTLAWIPIVIGIRWALHLDTKARRRILLISITALVVVTAVSGTLYFIPGPLPTNWTSSTSWQQMWTTSSAHSGHRSFMLHASDTTEQSLQSSVKRPLGLADGSPVIYSAWVRAPNNARGAIRISDNTGHIAERQFSNVSAWQLITMSLPIAVNTSSIVFGVAGLSVNPIYIDDLHAEIATTQTIPLNLPNPSAEEATPILAQVMLSTASAIGVYGQTASMLRDYRANLAVLPARLEVALAFLNTSFWGKYGIFARAATPSLPNGWDTVLGFLALSAILIAGIQIIVGKDRAHNRTLIGLFIVGISLLLWQTLAPMLSFAASGLWLPQGRYVFVGMGLLSCILAYGWLSWLPSKWRWWGVGMIIIVLLTVTIITLSLCVMFFKT